MQGSQFMNFKLFTYKTTSNNSKWQLTILPVFSKISPKQAIAVLQIHEKSSKIKRKWVSGRLHSLLESTILIMALGRPNSFLTQLHPQLNSSYPSTVGWTVRGHHETSIIMCQTVDLVLYNLWQSPLAEQVSLQSCKALLAAWFISHFHYSCMLVFNSFLWLSCSVMVSC